MRRTTVHRFHPIARDAGIARVSRVTTAVIAVGTVATLGLGAAIAAAAPPPKATKSTADFAEDKSKPATPPVRVDDGRARPQPPEELPESSSGDEDTTSGGS
jgi:hypothetical protein